METKKAGNDPGIVKIKVGGKGLQLGWGVESSVMWTAGEDVKLRWHRAGVVVEKKGIVVLVPWPSIEAVWLDG